jgi:16S rRNA (cytidine1402-2'-O)-methyltransferase
MGDNLSKPDYGRLRRAGTLYVVATPIGNLEDISARALRTLAEVDLVACEDTRHTGKLLRHFGVSTRLQALHQYNEREHLPKLIDRLQAGESIALVSDAGTPMVSDPGFHLVRAVRSAGLDVVPIPGACAAIAALSVSGLPSDRFAFEGFLPSKTKERRQRLQELVPETRTLIFYESPHRVVGSLRDVADILGGERPGVVARELTKHFETVRAGPLSELAGWLAQDATQQRGEFVILAHGAVAVSAAQEREGERVLGILAAALPVSQAAELAAAITGVGRRALYQRAIALRGEKT